MLIKYFYKPLYFIIIILIFNTVLYSEQKPQNLNPKITLNPSLNINYKSQFSLKMIGFMQLDTVFHNDGQFDHPNGTTIRRARVGFSGKTHKVFSYKFLYDFGNDNPELQDAFVALHLNKNNKFKLGQFKEPIGLEWQSPSPAWTFMELPLTAALTPRRSIGFAWENINEKFRTSMGVFGQNATQKKSDDEAFSFDLHHVYTIQNNHNQYIHLGTSLSHRKPDQSDNSFSYKTKSETSTIKTPVLNTGKVKNIDYANIIGFETLSIFTNYKFQAEYILSKVNRDHGLNNYKLDGLYFQLSTILNGGKFNFNRKKFIFTNHLNKTVWDNSFGTWELAYRFERLNFNRDGLNKGKLKRNALALNWHASQHIKTSLNYSHAKSDIYAFISNEDVHTIALRTHLKF